MSKRFFILKRIISRSLLILISILILNSNPVVAQSSFNPGLIISDDTLTQIPTHLSSQGLIQSYLASQNSFLANYKVDIGFEPGTSLVDPATFPSKPYYLQPKQTVGPYAGKQMLVSELIWQLATQDFGNGCAIVYQDLCVNNRETIINPAYILAMIQKESGLVYGTNAKLDPNLSSTKFLLDRVLGYYCFENPDRSKSCYDENPEWKYFKGFFRQMYYGLRFFRIHEKMCKDSRSFDSSHDNRFKVGNTISFDGIPVKFENAITCAMYLYTPHIYNSQYNSWVQLNYFKASVNLIKYNQEDKKEIDFRLPEQVVNFRLQ